MYSFTGDTVLDPFGGRFATSVAAARAGRDSLCVEVAPGYVASGVERVAADLRELAARGAGVRSRPRS